MKMSFKFEGGAEMAKVLNGLEKALSRKIEVDALMLAGEPIRDAAASMAPRGPGPGPHLADNIGIGSVTDKKLESRGRESETVVEVGPELRPDDVFWGFFQEYGTVRHAAQPFMRPAFEQEAPKALDILKDELWWALRRKLPASQERFVA